MANYENVVCFTCGLFVAWAIFKALQAH